MGVSSRQCFTSTSGPSCSPAEPGGPVLGDHVFVDGAGGGDGLLVALDPVGKAEGDFVWAGAFGSRGAEAEIGLSGLSGEPDADGVSSVRPVV